MNWIITFISSGLWAVFSVLIISSAMSIVTTTNQVAVVKIWLVILSFLMMMLSVYMFISGQKIKKKRISKKLHFSLMSTFRSGKLRIPLILFAEQNEVPIITAQKYIDSLVKPFRGKIDITADGMIIYQYKQNQSGKEL